jgi:3-oxoadipate enol-lactonase / 4-carboxymuconolactone decarboxylase
MPLINLHDHSTFYRLEGRDDAPALILAHSLGLDHGMWDPQMPDLAREFLVLRYDLRGHGASSTTGGEYTIEQLGRDALQLADALGLDRFAFCGLSIGGMIGQWLGVHAASRVTHLVLANTSPRPVAEVMETRRRAVLAEGMRAVEDAVMGRFFTAATLAADPPVVSWARRTLLANTPVGYAGCCAAIRDMDLADRTHEIAAPVLIIDGTSDISLPWAVHGERLAAALPAATVAHLDAAHISNLERPRSFSNAVLRFLRPPMDTRASGMRVRRAVLGNAHVDRAIANTTDFTSAFQELITTAAWGSVWTRPGLDERTRRLLVIAITASLGRWEEFRLHVRAALAHDLELVELEEALLQVAIYAGFPAANTAFAEATAIAAQRG